MPFIGTQPEVGGYSVLDALTASATASYTLQKDSANFVPNTANQLLVSLNGVIQKPGSSFTVSGSTLTFSSALSSSDSIDFILAMGEPLLVGTPSAGSVNTTQLATNAVTSAKITNANITQAKLASGVAGNGPAFHAHPSTGQSVSASTFTKVNLGTELFDTDSKFDTSNSRFTPTVAGIYSVHASVTYANANFSTTGAIIQIRKNGGNVAAGNTVIGGFEARHGLNISAMVQLDDDDYLEMYIYGPAQTISHNTNETHFSAAMVRSA
tara:strand:+ start:372 stop:1175 length:804 start_codon:yes stop_codon:yes gene_type:complete